MPFDNEPLFEADRPIDGIPAERDVIDINNFMFILSIYSLILIGEFYSNRQHITITEVMMDRITNTTFW